MAQQSSNTADLKVFRFRVAFRHGPADAVVEVRATSEEDALLAVERFIVAGGDVEDFTITAE